MLNGGESKWVTTDLFDTDANEKIIEHWDVIHELGGTNPAGRTQVDGATEIIDLHLTESNKEIVRRFMTEAFCEERTAPFSDFTKPSSPYDKGPETVVFPGLSVGGGGWI